MAAIRAIKLERVNKRAPKDFAVYNAIVVQQCDMGGWHDTRHYVGNLLLYVESVPTNVITDISTIENAVLREVCLDLMHEAAGKE